MLVKDFEEALLSKDMHNIDDEEDTLSLCDLPLYGDQSVDVDEWEDDLSQESQGSSSMSSTNHDYFEFSRELNPSPSTTIISNPDNIIFCGKLIPYKQPDFSPKKGSAFERKHQNKKKKGWGLFGWKLSSSRSSKVHVYSKKSSLHQSSPKKKSDENKNGKGYELPVHKMSILTSSSSGKARWYFLLFGLSRVSTEVDLRDIKIRQSRRMYPSPTSSPSFKFENDGKEEINGGKINGGWGLWGLIRALSCGGNHHPKTMVSESITYTR